MKDKIDLEFDNSVFTEFETIQSAIMFWLLDVTDSEVDLDFQNILIKEKIKITIHTVGKYER